jgi:hypothetical protein
MSNKHSVGDKIKYNGHDAEVTKTGIPKDYGPAVEIRLADGTRIETTPGLDPSWGVETPRG